MGKADNIAKDLQPLAVPIGSLQPYGNNSRRRTDANLAAIRASFDAFGQQRPILVYRFGRGEPPTVIAGNGGFLAAKGLGWSKIAASHFRGTAAEARAYAIADNRIAELSEWDADVLGSEALALRGQAELDSMLDALRLEDILGPVEEERHEAEEAAPEPPAGEPTTRAEDLWTLGRHRPLCGDTTKAEDVARLVGDERVACVWTDPPYAIYGSSTGIASDITDDKMVRPFFRDILAASVAVLKPFGHIYVSCDWRSWASWWEVAKGTGIVPKSMIVWNKGGGLGSNYQNSHELMLFGWSAPMQRNMRTKQTGGRSVNDSNVWAISRVPAATATGGREHNAQKPIELVARSLKNSTDTGDVVVDFFGGSGTTLVACEENDRAARVMEIDRRYCDVIVKRWESLTGEKATRS